MHGQQNIKITVSSHLYCECRFYGSFSDNVSSSDDIVPRLVSLVNDKLERDRQNTPDNLR